MLKTNLENYFIPEAFFATIEGFFDSYKYMRRFIANPPLVTPEIPGVATNGDRVQTSTISDTTPLWAMENERILKKAEYFKAVLTCLEESIVLAAEECVRPALWGVIEKALKEHLFYDASIYRSRNELDPITISKYTEIAYFKAYKLLVDRGLIEESTYDY